MPDPIIQWVVDTLIQDQGVGGPTDGRVNGTHIIDVPQPEYPMVTVERLTPGFVDPFAPVSYFEILLTSFSTNSYDEAYEILMAAKVLIHQRRITVDGYDFVIHASTNPLQDSDRTAQQVYFYKQAFEIHCNGG